MTTSTPTDAARLAGAAHGRAPPLLAIAGFTALGSIFEYPQILEEPTAEILALYREHQGAVIGWFLVLASAPRCSPRPASCSAGSPAARLGRWIAGVGIAAATVQVDRPARWVTLVPGISDDALDPARRAARRRTVRALHTVLGTVLGETVGYALTATFTVLVVIALRRHRPAHAGSPSSATSPPSSSPPASSSRSVDAGQPHQLRRLRRLVRLAPRGGRRAGNPGDVGA